MKKSTCGTEPQEWEWVQVALIHKLRTQKIKAEKPI